MKQITKTKRIKRVFSGPDEVLHLWANQSQSDARSKNCYFEGTSCYSYGGTEDKLINKDTDRHSWVFSSVEELEANGYADAHVDDSIALGMNPCIGLVYHGTKNIENTDWGKIKAKQVA